MIDDRNSVGNAFMADDFDDIWTDSALKKRGHKIRCIERRMEESRLTLIYCNAL